ncbi:MAG: metal-dependent transcriptional regulator [Actinomycetota bacterium]|nr:metal-dependent transcriptional regulator [Actinomycetota bacterium]MDA3004000.1 metal-dependent transcriptional regulator [Actinomycetota bacterium]
MQQKTEHHPAFEEYCECIFELEEDHVELIQARIADRLKFSRASVSEMIKRMEIEGLVSLSGPRIALTKTGRELAEGIVRKHRLAECFLIDVLHLSWSDAHHEACKWEHVINDEVEVALSKMLGNPTACPHGNPIPGSGHRSTLLTPLNTIEVGDSFTVARIPEELEETSGALDSLEANKMFPGQTGTVADRGNDGGVRVLISDSANSVPTAINSFISSRLLVTTKK